MPDGKVFYHQKLSDASPKTNEVDAINIALNFVSKITNDTIVLTVEETKKIDKNGHTAYEIYLSQRIDGVRLSYKNNETTVKVVVVGDRVYYMKGLFRNIIQSLNNSLTLGENAVIFMLDQNFAYIKSKEPFNSTKELFDKIKVAEYAYIYDSNGDFVACYKMLIGNNVFLFKLEDAEVM